MACLVEYCSSESTPSLGLCKKHLKKWHKAGEPVGDALEAWLKVQKDEELDVCLTPEALALEICSRLESGPCRDHYLASPFRILEPSAGNGAFVKAARQTWPEASITANEIREECRQSLHDAGADDVDIRDLNNQDICDIGPDLIVGNPPFAYAEQHIRLLLAAMKEGAFLVFLLRLGFYESHERTDFWKECPERFMAPIVPRPQYKLNSKGKPGSDSQAYGIFIWQKGFTGAPTRLPHIVWREKRVGKLVPGGKRKAKQLEIPAKASVVVSAAPELDVAPELEV